MTRYVLDDVRQVGAELARRGAELTDWLDRAAAEHPVRAAAEVGTAACELGSAELACVRAVSAAALRLTAAAASVAACVGAVDGVDGELGRWLCR